MSAGDIVGPGSLAASVIVGSVSRGDSAAGLLGVVGMVRVPALLAKVVALSLRPRAIAEMTMPARPKTSASTAIKRQHRDNWRDYQEGAARLGPRRRGLRGRSGLPVWLTLGTIPPAI